MAYRLKNVRYKNNDISILLQNENGPCPLLAAANALLLRGSIELPPKCVHSQVASIDDVCNMLAEQALLLESAKDDTSGSSVFHVHEFMTIFPTLQYGMDVNPKFTMGPSGVEYTKNLTAFEMCKVELVHGWLLDPQDVETVALVGTKTYNELMEDIIAGSDAAILAEEIQQELAKREENDNSVVMSNADQNDSEEDPEQDATPKGATSETNESIESSTELNEEIISASQESTQQHVKSEEQQHTTTIGEFQLIEGDTAQTNEESKIETSIDSDIKPDINSDSKAEPVPSEKSATELKEDYNKLVEKATKGTLINNFLQSTSHQLTPYGLLRLYEYVKEDALCVFFRNNHFSTITKRGGVLYMLVTDLGYATVDSIVWEKLDNIDGDTEYMGPNFTKAQLLDDFSTVAEASPEVMLATRGQAQGDYALALQMAATGGAPGGNNEAKMLAEAEAASLRDLEASQAVAGTVVSLPPLPAQNNDDVATTNATTESTAKPPQPNDSTTTSNDADHLLALQYQAQFGATSMSEQEAASLALAKQLDQEERIRAQQQQTARQPRGNSQSSGCAIS